MSGPKLKMTSTVAASPTSHAINKADKPRCEREKISQLISNMR